MHVGLQTMPEKSSTVTHRLQEVINLVQTVEISVGLLAFSNPAHSYFAFSCLQRPRTFLLRSFINFFAEENAVLYIGLHA